MKANLINCIGTETHRQEIVANHLIRLPTHYTSINANAVYRFLRVGIGDYLLVRVILHAREQFVDSTGHLRSVDLHILQVAQTHFSDTLGVANRRSAQRHARSLERGGRGGILIDLRLQSVRIGSHHAVNLISAEDEYEGWEAGDSVLACQLAVLVGVDADKNHVGITGAQLVKDGMHSLAGTAPRS